MWLGLVHPTRPRTLKLALPRRMTCRMPGNPTVLVLRLFDMALSTANLELAASRIARPLHQPATLPWIAAPAPAGEQH